MKNKVILMSIDGMRPDGLLSCKNPFVQTALREASYTLNARTVVPSVTLPCHMSLFHSVTPTRHGILSNTFVPQVHQIKGLFEKISSLGGECGIVYGWEPLRDVARPGSCKYAVFVNAYTDESVDTVLTDKAMEIIERKSPDFFFIYQVDTDEKGGHDSGWMTDEYLRRISLAMDNVRRVVERFGDEYTVIVTADHGGHDRMHGTELDEDMTIPMLFFGKEFEKGKQLSGVSILDIAPTVAAVMGFEPEKEWEGKSLI